MYLFSEGSAADGARELLKEKVGRVAAGWNDEDGETIVKPISLAYSNFDSSHTCTIVHSADKRLTN